MIQGTHSEFQDPGKYYSEKLVLLKGEKEILSQKDSRFELSRFILFFGGIGIILFFVLKQESSLVFPLIIFFLGIYLWVLQNHGKLKEILEGKIRGIENIENEILALEGEYSKFGEGNKYIDPQHDYSSDLDLFGQKSIFQYFNRTLTPMGEDRLASWFLKPSSSFIIENRQNSVQELMDKPDWVQDFREIKISEKTKPEHLKNLFQWLSKTGEINFPQWVKLLLILDPWFMGGLGLGILLEYLFPELGKLIPFIHSFQNILGLSFLFQLGLIAFYAKRINQVHQVLSGQGSTLFSYASMIAMVEKELFSSPFLVNIQSQLNHEPKASLALNSFSKLLKSFDGRLNILVSAFANGLYLSDIRLVLKLENWKRKYSDKPALWFDSIHEIEAILSLSIIAFNESSWTFPRLNQEFQCLEAQKMGHPLIPKTKRVSNSFQIQSPNQVILITGSNMAGKSTFLRTIGVNLVLAQMGSKVCAESFSFEPVPLYTSLRIVDSLQENTSSFYAELKRLEVLVKRSLQGENIFFLLDEILRGTNSNDRHLGSKSVIKHLIQNHVFGILATHDLGLGELVKDFPKEIRNMHFDVQVQNDELYFDYTLKPGICTSLNASILMKKIGLNY